MKTECFDEAFDMGHDISSYLDLENVNRPALEQRRTIVDFPEWMIEELNREAERLGISRQALIKVWIADRLAQQGHADIKFR